ncbi:hypothetical protein ACF0H5_006620 [Mactra antiquata]
MAAKPESKYSGTKRVSQTKDEFFVQNENVALVMQYKDKVEHMYDIEINGEEKTEDGQWLILMGEPVDRRNAKNYITAMCNPSERKQVQFPSASELTNPETLEYIEKRTNAFIRPLKKIALFEITGTELAVTLALSEIEELAGTGIIGCDDASEGGDHDSDIIEISPSSNKGSSRLSDVLERALSSHSDGNCSVADYRNTCPSVQRVLVNCLQNEDEPDGVNDDCMFGDGKVTEGMKDVTSVAGSKTLNTRMYFIDSDSDDNQEEIVDKGLNKITEKFKDTKVKDSSKTDDNPLLTKQQKYLKSFGLSVGFEESKVIKAIRFVDERTRPSDFLDILNSLSDDSDEDVDEVKEKKEVIEISDDDDAVIIESETIEYVNDDKEVIVRTDTGKDEKNENAALPDGYKERLIRDILTEDENCSREELKRRNAERQQLLRQNFLRQQQNQVLPTNAQKKSKKKNRKKKKANASENQAEKNDNDQTCVMKVWNNEKESPATDDCQFPNNQKRKNQNFCNLPNQAQQQQGKFRQNSPNRAHQWTPVQSNKKNLASQNEVPRKGNYKKPTQVVNPVNIPKLMDINTKPTLHMAENCELRYIVIDGSNVAMTHGNGKHFSCKGIKICVEYFRQRGHDRITVFIPQWRQYRPSDTNPILDQDILQQLKDDGSLVFTPSRKIGQRLVASYDDRFVLELAEAEEGIIVSNDQYRDLMTEKSAWKKIIHERLLMYTFVRDRFMPPNDPLGRDGPCLEDFLKIQTYTDDPSNPRLMQAPYQYNQHQQQQHYHKPSGQGHGFVQYNQGQGYSYSQGHNNSQGQCQGHSTMTYPPSTQNQGSYANAASYGQFNFGLQQPGQQPPNYYTKNQAQTLPGHTDPFNDHSKSPRQHQKGQGHWKTKGQRIPRTEQESDEIFQELKKLFPDDDQEEKIKKVLSNHLYEHDLEKLTNDCMNILF